MKIRFDDIVSRLADTHIASPRLEARIMLAHVLNCEASEIVPGEFELPEDKALQLEKIVSARLRHHPLDKLLGAKDFYKYRFQVNEAVLSPRPDTEILVEKALELAAGRNFASLLDLGTGSGCILLSILADCPEMKGTAVDASAGALAIARKNAELLGVSERVAFMHKSWFDQDFVQNFPLKFDLVVSNPPYIPDADIAMLDEEVRAHDPLSALSGGADGYDHYRRIAEIAPELLNDNGFILLEVGINQADEVAEIFAGRQLKLVEKVRDLAGIERCVILKK